MGLSPLAEEGAKKDTMTRKDEDNQEPQEKWRPHPESETEPEEEPQHPGWLTLAQVFKSTDPFWEKFLFLLSYEYSSNIYVIKGDYLTIVDPGNDYTGYMDLFKLDYRPEQIKKIVLTHGHRDHSMGAFELLRAYPALPESGGFELICHPDSPVELKDIVKKFGCRVTEVKGGETLELSGLEWEVIYTPGHTVDGLSFYHAPSKTAFTGDMVMAHAMAEADQNAGGRLDHYLYGVKTLLKKDIEHILPGHGFPIAELGHTVIEQTYESLLMKIIGAEAKTPWVSGAEALAQKGLLEEAVFCCDKALANNPENPRALRIKGLCLTDLGRGQEAIEVMDKLLAKEPKNPFLLTAKGHALLGLGNYAESLEFFDSALKLHPGIQEAQVYKGMALYLSGRIEEALDIEIFKEEFSSRLQQELAKGAGPPAAAK
jgi:glyoxylase-like metal-dependent hydrolase (beta-lactamase superfamily II)